MISRKAHCLPEQQRRQIPVAIYRHFGTVTLICAECEHTWTVDTDANPVLKDLPPFATS
jgi:hypothetical protein